MPNKFHNLSINGKLLFLLLFSSFCSFLFGGLFLMILEVTDFRRTAQDELIGLAKMVGNRSSAALMFEDVNLANENLLIFESYPLVGMACLFDSQGNVFAEYYKKHTDEKVCPESISDQKTAFIKFNLLTIVEPIEVDKNRIGSAYLYVNLTEAYWQKLAFTLLIFMVLILVSVLTFLLSRPLLKHISRPLNKLVKTVTNITNTQDYSLRAEKVHQDEIGDLVDVFNSLINTVELQNLALTKAKDRYLALFDDNPTIIFNIMEAGGIVSVNQTTALQFGMRVDQIQGKSIFEFIQHEDAANLEALIELCFNNPLLIYKQEIRMTCDQQQTFWVRATARLIENDSHANSLLLVCEDVTEMHFLNEKIAYQASYDNLTGLFNRAQFDAHCEQIATLARINKTEHVLCYLDLDQFKVINDTCGHQAGDALLKQLGELLKQHIRYNDYLARMGGDEFAILMDDYSLNQAVRACEKLLETVSGYQFSWENRSFSIGMSIGMTVINSQTINPVEALKEADAACNIAKDKGRNRIHLFSKDDQELTLRQGEMQWVEKIQKGIEQNSFRLYGQPIVSIADNGEGLHFETLLRYIDEAGAIVAPGHFLPAAERYNLAAALDRWVIRNLFCWLFEHPDFMENLSVCSVNLSGRTLSDENMFEFMTEQFSQWKIPPQKICFEITETAAIDNFKDATRFINGLRSIGCLFSLDDFGSGLSSFAYLKKLPVDYLKIDGVFVKDILNDRFDFAMVKSITEVGKVMSKKTVAEFVENEQIFNLLYGLGVDYAQGYGIGKPVPLEELRLIRPFKGSV